MAMVRLLMAVIGTTLAGGSMDVVPTVELLTRLRLYLWDRVGRGEGSWTRDDMVWTPSWQSVSRAVLWRFVS